MNKSAELLEKDVWDKYFAEALSGKGQEMDNADLWWQISEDDTVDIIFDIFNNKNINILEAGCGSGGTNFSLEKKLNVDQIDLLDISENALLYAKKITPKHVLKKTRYIQGSILEPNNEHLKKYDLVWNTGLIEHYQKDEIVKIIANMLNLVAETEANFTDNDLVSDWAKGYVNAVCEAGIFKGDENGNFNPKGELKRAETATVIYRLLDADMFKNGGAE